MKATLRISKGNKLNSFAINFFRKFSVGVLDALDGFDFNVAPQNKHRGIMQQYYLNVLQESFFIKKN